MPVSAIDLDQRSQKEYKNKFTCYLILDILLTLFFTFTVVTISLIRGNGNFDVCKDVVLPPSALLLVCIFISLLVDACMWKQIRAYYISRSLALTNTILDLCIFALGIWLTVILVKVQDPQSDCQMTDWREITGASCVIFAIFSRVYYIVFGILYFFSIFWITICCPNACACTKWLMGDDLMKEVWEQLEETEWTFNSDCMQPGI